jgi:hypothetical protein
VDACADCIESQAARWARMEHMDWSALDLAGASAESDVAQVGDNVFDAIIDKGLFDALITSPDEGLAVKRYVGWMFRLLKPQSSVGGPFIVVSHAPPPARLGLLLGVAEEDPSVSTAVDAAVARLSRASRSGGSLLSKVGSELLTVEGGGEHWRRCSVWAVRKPALGMGGGEDEDDEEDEEEEEDEEDGGDTELSEQVRGGLWSLLAKEAHFVYACWK